MAQRWTISCTKIIWTPYSRYILPVHCCSFALEWQKSTEEAEQQTIETTKDTNHSAMHMCTHYQTSALAFMLLYKTAR